MRIFAIIMMALIIITAALLPFMLRADPDMLACCPAVDHKLQEFRAKAKEADRRILALDLYLQANRPPRCEYPLPSGAKLIWDPANAMLWYYEHGYTPMETVRDSAKITAARHFEAFLREVCRECDRY